VHSLAPIFLLVASFWGTTVTAQAKPDTLSAAERTALLQRSRATSFGHYWMADSCARRGDSACAAFHFLQVDPLLILYYDVAPDSLPKLFDRMRLPAATRAQYAALFTEMLAAPRSAAYTDFKRMRDEDQTLRTVRSRCGDSLTCARAAQRMRVADSAHFEALYDYVRQHGWPSVADGGLYAQVLAIHDHKRHEYYIPIIQEAVANGSAQLNLLDLMMQWRSQKSPEQLRQYLDTATRRVFDVSSMLGEVLPASLPRIQKALKGHCARWYLVLETPTNARFSAIMDRFHANDNGPEDEVRGVLTQFANELQRMCPKRLHRDVWHVSWMPGERERLLLYLTKPAR